MNLDELMGFMMANDMVDENFGLKEQDEKESEKKEEKVKQRILEKDKNQSFRRN